MYLEQVENELPFKSTPTISRGPFAVFLNESLIATESPAVTRVGDVIENERELPVAIIENKATEDALESNAYVDAQIESNFEPAVFPEFLLHDLAAHSPSGQALDDHNSRRSSSYAVAIAGSPEFGESPSINVSEGHVNSLHDHFSLGKPILQVSPGVEHLLHHYVNHVVDLMTVISTPKGPWKSIHIPRALKGSAELAFTGKTSHACSALFHALLTISAYNLAANHSITGQDLQAQHYREMALRFKARSLTYLKAGLQPNCPVKDRGKYKEVLAVMLSMVTIDVSTSL